MEWDSLYIGIFLVKNQNLLIVVMGLFLLISNEISLQVYVGVEGEKRNHKLCTLIWSVFALNPGRAQRPTAKRRDARYNPMHRPVFLVL